MWRSSVAAWGSLAKAELTSPTTGGESSSMRYIREAIVTCIPSVRLHVPPVFHADECVSAVVWPSDVRRRVRACDDLDQEEVSPMSE